MKSLIDYMPARLASFLERSPEWRRLAHGAFWTLAGTIVARALSIPVSIVLARWMGPARYGELGIIYNSVDLFIVFAGFGLGLTATKYVAEFRHSDPARAGRIMALAMMTAVVTAGVTALVMILCAPYLAAHALNAPRLAPSLRIGSVILFISAINGAQQGALYGFEAFRTTARIQSIVGVLNLPASLIGCWLGGVEGILWSMVFCRLADWLLRRQALLKLSHESGVPLSFKGCMEELPILWKFSLPALLSGVLVAPVNWLCAAMLVNRAGGYQEMGIFSAANQWYGALLFLPTVLGSGLLPFLSGRMGEKSAGQSHRVVWFMLRLNAIIVLPAVLLGSLCSPWIMHFYGPAYAQGWPTLVAVLCTAGIFAVLIPVSDVITASGSMWTGMAMNAGWAIIFIISTRFLVHNGAAGLSSARLIAYVAHALWTIAFAVSVLRQKSHAEASQPDSSCLLAEHDAATGI